MPRRYRALYSSKRVARRAKYRKSARSQAKQIASLSHQISKVAEISSLPLQLRWSRTNSFIDRDPLTAGNSGTLTTYICPIPIAPNQQGPLAPDFGDTGPVATDADDFKKSKVWITSVDANQKPRCTHRGGYITFKLNRINISLRFVKVMLIRARPSIADQISLQRQMQYFEPTANPPILAGQSSRLILGYDFIHNPTSSIHDSITGYQMNDQIWEVLGSKTYKFGSDKPFIAAQTTPIPPNAIGNPMRTTATGYFKLPRGGAVHKIWSQDHTQQSTNLDYKNQRSEKNVFLVVFSQRGCTTVDVKLQPIADAPANELKLSMQVRDTYSCSEGSLTPYTGNGPPAKRGRGRPKGSGLEAWAH